MQYTTTRIYSRALELTALTRDVINAFPPGYGFLADQLRRATASIVLNFAEGYGKATPRDQRRFFIIAKGSTFEVSAALDLAFTFGLTPAAQHTRALDLCDHLARMLTRFRR